VHVGVVSGRKRWQKWKGARRFGALGLVLDVVDDDSIEVERAQALDLLGGDVCELVGSRRALGWRKAIQANARAALGDLIEQRRGHGGVVCHTLGPK
jgi:hypothetical protein